MILNIRGTHGSGKSTVVRSLLDAYPSSPLGAGRRPDGYRVAVPWLSRPLYVVGPYATGCGGCDAVQPYSLIWPRVAAYYNNGAHHVIFEGALVSSSYGNIGRASEEYGDDVVFAFLNTPLRVCLDRLRHRRVARGNTNALNPRNTAVKYRNSWSWYPRMRDALRRRVVVLDYRAAGAGVRRLLREGDTQPAGNEAQLPRLRAGAGGDAGPGPGVRGAAPRRPAPGGS